MKEIIKKHGKGFALAGFFILLCNGLSVLHPFVVKKIVDIDWKASNIQAVLLSLLICYIIIHLVLIFMKNIRNIQNNQLMAKVLRDIRMTVFEKILTFKMKTFDQYNSSELYTRLTADCDNLFDLFFGTIQILVNNVVYILLMVIMMFFADIHIAIIGASTILLVAISSLSFTKKLKKIDNQILQKRDEENKEFSELYHKNKITYLFQLQKRNIKKLFILLEQELKVRKHYIFVHHFMYPVSLIIEALGIYFILYNALHINLSISLGSIYLVLFYIKQCRSPLDEMFDQLEKMQTCLNSFRKINTILKEEEEEKLTIGEEVDDLDGDIEFQNVCMSYGKEMVLKNLSFTIEKGAKVTIAGRTGVGKSTLTSILMKLYEIESGKILIDGYDISKISIQSLRQHISYISQNPYIFEDTLRNNITLNDETISDEEILKVIDQIGVRNIYERFENGLDEIIKQNRLSYGELQVISFIRAITHEASLYIFDEPTSNLDLKTERLIQNLVNAISKNSTVIIVAHRKSTIENSNKVIYLKDGKIDVIINKEQELMGRN